MVFKKSVNGNLVSRVVESKFVYERVLASGAGYMDLMHVGIFAP